MKENITTELSNALKNGDKERIHTLRLVLAAIKDKEIVEKANQLGISMVFTSERHFYH